MSEVPNANPATSESYLFRYSSQSQMHSWAELWEISETMIEMAEHARMMKREAAAGELHLLAFIYRDGILNAVDAIIEASKAADKEREEEAERAKNRPVTEDDE